MKESQLKLYLLLAILWITFFVWAIGVYKISIKHGISPLRVGLLIVLPVLVLASVYAVWVIKNKCK